MDIQVQSRTKRRCFGGTVPLRNMGFRNAIAFRQQMKVSTLAPTLKLRLSNPLTAGNFMGFGGTMAWSP